MSSHNTQGYLEQLAEDQADKLAALRARVAALQAERDEEAEAHRILWNMYHDVLAEGRLLREALEHAIVALRGYGNMLHEIPDTPLITAEVARVRRLEAVLEAAEAQDPPASANLARALAAYREGERPGGEV